MKILFYVSNYSKNDKATDGLYCKELMGASIGMMMSAAAIDRAAFEKHTITHDVIFANDENTDIEDYDAIINIDGKYGFEDLSITSIRYNFIMNGIEFVYEKVKSVYKTLCVVLRVIDMFTSESTGRIMGLVWVSEPVGLVEANKLHGKRLIFLCRQITQLLIGEASFTSEDHSDWTCMLTVDKITETKFGIEYDTPNIKFKNSVTGQEIPHPEYYSDVFINYLSDTDEPRRLSLKYDGISSVYSKNGHEIVFNIAHNAYYSTKS